MKAISLSRKWCGRGKVVIHVTLLWVTVTSWLTTNQRITEIIITFATFHINALPIYFVWMDVMVRGRALQMQWFETVAGFLPLHHTSDKGTVDLVQKFSNVNVLDGLVVQEYWFFPCQEMLHTLRAQSMCLRAHVIVNASKPRRLVMAIEIN